MSNLVDSTLLASVEQGFEDLFDTFARPQTFTVYKKPEEVIVSLDPDFDPAWSSSQGEGVTYTEVSDTFDARIWYLDYEQQLKEFFFKGGSVEGARFIKDSGQIKIQLREEGYNYIKEATKAYFAGSYWSVTSDVKSVGIFGFKYYIFILRRME